MTAEEQKDRIRYFYEVVVSQNQLDRLDDYIADTCTVRVGETENLCGIDGMREHLQAIRVTYPDYSMRIIRQHCDGEYVISEFIMQAKHEGAWIGIKPTGKTLTFTGVDIDRMVDGKIVEHGGAVNTFETLWENRLIQPV
ncbi:ester cyclase [Sphaerochaeta sp. S2]|uniref:ester cyclase n=1 Tax=Sphaerochaeta sp. S2 TaxID=2798868 RepID=UPI0018EA2F6B|nr:ester cyclase [Sphaerochaeta sp. S2]MBJ2357370.1 ester cyclase [Sphaerochaeta sp. S2]MCK9348805.1 ester cyclase [Sphaerochaeta sp.]MDD4301841.1 ester cyclase [Sphaerochaeta sp.]MDY0243729.1 ester cyclase [Sphaerochaeta sp.]